MTMVRLQVLLTPDENTAVRLEALKRHVSISEVVRERLQTLVPQAMSDEEYWNDPLFKTIGMAYSSEDEPDDGSVHHDTYLYGGELED
jgi:hypothetical protein